MTSQLPPTVSIRRRRGLALARGGAFYLVVICVALLFVFPVVWVVTTSLKTRVETYSETPTLLFHPTLANYARAYQAEKFPLFARNSVIVACATTVLIVLVGSQTAYALARFRLRGQALLSLAVIAARMFPPVALLPGFFLLAVHLGLVDTLPIVIFAHTAYGLPFIIFLFLGFISEIPRELDEAAMIDGCSRLSLFYKVLLPNLLPGLAAAAVLSFVYSWNEFLFALILTRGEAKTLPVTLSEFSTFLQVDWQGLTATATIMLIPSVIVGLVAQGYLVRGLTSGAVKG